MCFSRKAASSREGAGTLTSYLPGLLGLPDVARFSGAPPSGASEEGGALAAGGGRCVAAAGSSAASGPATGALAREVQPARRRRATAVARDAGIDAGDRTGVVKLFP